MKHKDADVLHAWINGAKIECSIKNGEWFPISNLDVNASYRIAKTAGQRLYETYCEHTKINLTPANNWECQNQEFWETIAKVAKG